LASDIIPGALRVEQDVVEFPDEDELRNQIDVLMTKLRVLQSSQN
jgi:hypothetical protein